MREKWGVVQKKSHQKKAWADGKKYQMIHAKRRPWHPKTVNLNTFCLNFTFKNRYMTSKNGSIGRLFVTPPTFWNWQKIRKNVEIHPPLSKCFRHRWVLCSGEAREKGRNNSSTTSHNACKWKLVRSETSDVSEAIEYL